jgi:predicted transcriptional regulator
MGRVGRKFQPFVAISRFEFTNNIRSTTYKGVISHANIESSKTMSETAEYHELKAEEAIEVCRAIGHESRLAILLLVGRGTRNINEICQALDLSQPAVSRHIQQLEQAGLIISEYVPGQQGLQKRCRLRHGGVALSFAAPSAATDSIVEVSMPIGMYTLAHAVAPCGLASRDGFIGYIDQPQAFFEPDRGRAQILWMAAGFIEYVFPCHLPTTVKIDRLDLLMEICSEAPNFNEDWPSDITIWVNGVEIGTWTSPGDFGAKRGTQNPDWWHLGMTQHGLLKHWCVTAAGSQIDGQSVSATGIALVNPTPGQPITVRIGVKPEAKHLGGFNLFGAGFGNYGQDLLMRLHVSPDPNQEPRKPSANSFDFELPSPSKATLIDP